MLGGKQTAVVNNLKKGSLWSLKTDKKDELELNKENKEEVRKKLNSVKDFFEFAKVSELKYEF